MSYDKKLKPLILHSHLRSCISLYRCRLHTLILDLGFSSLKFEIHMLWHWMVTIWKAQVHFFSGSSQIIKSFNRANNHKRLQLCALLKFFDNVIQSYLLFFFQFTNIYDIAPTILHRDIAPKRVCPLTMENTRNLQVQGIVIKFYLSVWPWKEVSSAKTFFANFLSFW